MSEVYQGSLLQEARRRVSNPNYKASEKQYQCNTCKDSGVIATTFDGNEVPIKDVLSSQLAYAKPCHCQVEKQMHLVMQYSNIDIEEYTKKNFETFKRDTEEAQNMYDLAHRFLDTSAKGVGFFGKSGTGKTHICTAICNALAKAGIQHRYLNYRTDIQDLKSLIYRQDEYNKKINDFKNTKVLYIDDLFKLAKNNNGEMNMQELQIIYDIINSRYLNNKRIIISSEYTVSEMKMFDVATAGRIFEMIGELGMKVEGNNRRFQKNKVKAVS